MCYFTFVHHYKKVVFICFCSSTTVVFVSLLKDILFAIVENNEWIPWIYSWLVTNLHTSHNLSTCLKFPLSQPYMKGFRMTEVIAIMWQPENTRSTVLVTFNGSTCIFKTRWNVQWIGKCYLGDIWDIQKEIKDVHGWPQEEEDQAGHKKIPIHDLCIQKPPWCAVWRNAWCNPCGYWIRDSLVQDTDKNAWK